MPSFVARVERPERGGEWISYLEERERGRRALGRAARARPRHPRRGDRPRGAAAVGRRASEDELLAALLFEAAAVSEDETRAALRSLPPDERAAMLAELVGERAQPPPPPRPRLRGAPLPLRGGVRLRRLPRPPAPPAAHRPVADARPRAGRRACPTSSTTRASATCTATGLERSRDEYARIVDAGPPELAPLRALPRLPDPLRARHERARGDAPDRAALRAARGTPPTAPWRTRCTPRSRACTPRWRPR